MVARSVRLVVLRRGRGHGKVYGDRSLADVSDAIAVAVDLIGVGETDTVVTRITDTVAISIGIRNDREMIPVFEVGGQRVFRDLFTAAGASKIHRPRGSILRRPTLQVPPTGSFRQ